MNKKFLGIICFLLPLLLLAACQPEALSPPRLATQTAASASQPAGTVETIFLPAPTPTPDPLKRNEIGFEPADTLEVWINETSPEHEEALQEMIGEFTQESGIDVALRLISPPLLPELVQTAVLSDTLPDVVLHPLEYSLTWSEEGILDPDAAASILAKIGPNNFNQSALALVDVNSHPSAIPSDGYQQIWLYRADWVADEGLQTPNNFAEMMANAETMFDPDNIISGIVIPTESNLINTHRAFEHLALANGCQLVDNKGEVRLLDESCRQAIDFYFSIVNQYSPTGVQTDTSARNAFLEGRTSIIMTSPEILPALAETPSLIENTGIMTYLNGWDTAAQPANFGNISYLGVTTEADTEAAGAFIEYWFNNGYAKWLAVDSERKVPMYLGTAEEPTLYIDQWGNAPLINGQSLTDLFGEDTVNMLKENVANSNRWGFNQGQGAVIGQLYENLTFSIILQEMLSGYFDSSQTIEEAAERVIELIPDYQFLPTPTPTPTPTPIPES